MKHNDVQEKIRTPTKYATFLVLMRTIQSTSCKQHRPGIAPGREQQDQSTDETSKDCQLLGCLSYPFP